MVVICLYLDACVEVPKSWYVFMCYMKEKEHDILISTCKRLFVKLSTRLPIRAAQNICHPLLKTEDATKHALYR